MNKQRGVIAILYLWIAGGIAVTILGLSIALKVQTSRLATAKAETIAVQGKFDLFKSEVQTLGEQQAAKAKALDESNKQLKEKADAQSAKSRADLAAVYARYNKLRQQASNSSSGLLPAAASGSSSPALVTFDRAALDRGLADADRVLQGGAGRLLQRGDQAIVDLDAARGWAQKLKLSYALVGKAIE